MGGCSDCGETPAFELQAHIDIEQECVAYDLALLQGRCGMAAGQLARLDGHRRAAGKKSLGQRSLGTATTTLISTETRFLILNKTQFQTWQTFLSLSAQWAPTAMLKTTGCLLCCIAKSTAFKKTTTRQIQNPNGFLNECLEKTALNVIMLQKIVSIFKL